MEISITALFVALTMYVLCLTAEKFEKTYKAMTILLCVFIVLLLAALLY